jgi:hypothetical protein
MVQDEDLEAAVAEGIITQAQVDRLRAFALRRLPQSAAERVDEERFRFLPNLIKRLPPVAAAVR